MNSGLARGLTVSNQADQQIEALRFREQMNLRAHAEAEQKNKLFAQDLEFQNAMNSHDNAAAKSFAQGKVKEIGEFVRNNPDFETNLEKRALLNSKIKEIKDNPILLRGMATDEAFKQLNSDLAEVAKNPSLHDVDAYDTLLQQRQNYLKYGHQDGEEAAQKFGKQAFVYKKPQDFVADLPGTIMKEGEGMNDFEIVRGENPGEFWTQPKNEQVQSLTQATYERHKRQVDKEATKLGIPPEQRTKWVEDQLRAGFKKHYSAGDVNALWRQEIERSKVAVQKLAAQGKLQKANNSKGSTYTPFDNFTDPRIPAGQTSPELLRKVYGDKPAITVMGNRDAKADLTGFDFNYDGRYVKREGVPMLMGNVEIPLDVALQKGIISKKGMFEDDDLDGSNVKRNHKITSDFLGKAVIESRFDAKGKEYQVVKVSHQMPVDPADRTARQMYNTHADVDKHVPASTDPYQTGTTTTSDKPAQIEQNGYTYYLNPQTGRYE